MMEGRNTSKGQKLMRARIDRKSTISNHAAQLEQPAFGDPVGACVGLDEGDFEGLDVGLNDGA
jgi:hypothetical protein